MKLMDIDSDTLGIPDTDYDARVTMPSAEFTRIVRDLSQLGESVRIEVSKEGVRFASEGEAANGSVLLRPTEGAGAIGKVKKATGEGGEEEEDGEDGGKKTKVKKEKSDEDVEMDDDEEKDDDEGEEEQEEDEDEEESGKKRKRVCLNSSLSSMEFNIPSCAEQRCV